MIIIRQALVFALLLFLLSRPQLRLTWFKDSPDHIGFSIQMADEDFPQYCIYRDKSLRCWAVTYWPNLDYEYPDAVSMDDGFLFRTQTGKPK